MSVIVPTLPPAPARGQAPDDYIQTADTWAAALPGFSAALNALGAEAELNAATAEAAKNTALTAKTDAETAATAAAASALSALNAPGTSATSTTSNSISLGSKTFTIQANKAFVVGQFVVLAYTAAPDNYMVGQITAYNSTTGALTVTSVAIVGSGTWANWTVSPSAPFINPNDNYTAMATMAYMYN